MRIGQRVRLSERGLGYYNKKGGAPARREYNWQTRQGTIARVTRAKQFRVHWDGNKHFDEYALPGHFFEEIE